MPLVITSYLMSNFFETRTIDNNTCGEFMGQRKCLLDLKF